MKKNVINLGGNLYNIDGTLRRKAPIKAVTIPELEQMIDECPDEGLPGAPKAKENMIGLLWYMYDKYGNPHKDELIERIQNAAKANVTEEQIATALEEINEQLEPAPEEDPAYDINTTKDEYVEYEEAA